MPNEGDEIPGKETRYLIIEIFLQKYKDFIRKGVDLLYPYYKRGKKEDWKGENSYDDNKKVNCNNQ